MGNEVKPKEKVGDRILNIVTCSGWRYRRVYWVYLILVGIVAIFGYLGFK